MDANFEFGEGLAIEAQSDLFPNLLEFFLCLRFRIQLNNFVIFFLGHSISFILTFLLYLFELQVLTNLSLFSDHCDVHVLTHLIELFSRFGSVLFQIQNLDFLTDLFSVSFKTGLQASLCPFYLEQALHLCCIIVDPFFPLIILY